jgi:hypothetical protein
MTLPRMRELGAMLLGLSGVFIFASVVDKAYPIGDWLFWPLSVLWAWVLLFNLACVGFGQFVLVRGMRMRHLPVLESAVFSMMVGTVGFALFMYAGGALALFHTSFAVGLPVAMLAVGAYDGYRLLSRWRTEAIATPYTGPALIVSAIGVCCLGLIYLGLLTPESISYDADWFHLRIAQDYARWGRILPFHDYNATVPHLASLLFTWTYLLPGLQVPQIWMCALHLEFTLFLWTLAGVAAGIQRLTRDHALKGSWVVFFLFPIIFVCDSNVGCSADHVLAFFSMPIALAVLEITRSFESGSCALLATAAAGAILTKYQAIYLLVPAGILVVVSWIGFVRDRRAPIWAPVILIGLFVLLSSPHFIKNCLFYHNPFYPFLREVFSKSPVDPYLYNAIGDDRWVPSGSPMEKIRHAAALFFTFSFKPHYSFTKNVPLAGSLFTLLLPGLILVQERRATAQVAALASGALFMWATVYNLDRHLQTFMPVMVCVTGALLVQLWRLGPLARAGLVPLVAFQIVWGSDAPFYSAQYSGGNRLKSAVDLIRSGFEGHAATRFLGYRRDFLTIERALPRDAKVLLHASHLSLGINRDVLLDHTGFQDLITYRQIHTARELYDYYRSLGITHIVESQRLGETTYQEIVIYYSFVTRFGIPVGRPIGILTQLPPHPPPVERPYRVLCLGVPDYTDGLYPVASLNSSRHLPGSLRHFNDPEKALKGSRIVDLLAEADVILAGAGRGTGDVPPVSLGGYQKMRSPADLFLYVRRH